MNPQITTEGEAKLQSSAETRSKPQEQAWLRFDYHSSGVCSWCLAEAGIAPMPNQSHGICQRHAEAWLKEAGL